MGNICGTAGGGDASGDPGQGAAEVQQMQAAAPVPAPAAEEPPSDLTKQVKWRYADLSPLQEKNPMTWSSWQTPDDVLAELSKLSEDDQKRPFSIKAGEELKDYNNADLVKEALTPMLRWMYADLSDFSAAKHNPFRWSSNEGLDTLVAELQKLGDEDKKRKVCIRTPSEDREYESVVEALKIISPAVNWMFDDYSNMKMEYHNPFRWTGHDNIEEAYTRMQLMSEEDLARPVIVREGGKETKIESARKAIEELAPLVGKGGGEGDWSMEAAFELAKKGEEEKFQGKAARLHTGEVDSVTKCVEGLNEGSIKCPYGICIMWSESHDAYYLMYRSDMKEKAFANFDLGSTD